MKYLAITCFAILHVYSTMLAWLANSESGLLTQILVTFFTFTLPFIAEVFWFVYAMASGIWLYVGFACVTGLFVMFSGLSIGEKAAKP